MKTLPPEESFRFQFALKEIADLDSVEEITAAVGLTLVDGTARLTGIISCTPANASIVNLSFSLEPSGKYRRPSETDTPPDLQGAFPAPRQIGSPEKRSVAGEREARREGAKKGNQPDDSVAPTGHL